MTPALALPVSASCATAILAGRKTMARYVAEEPAAECPFGGPGALLWLAEPWRLDADGVRYESLQPELAATWQPARGMPRELARAWVRLDSIRLERLADIPLADLAAEGSLWLDQPCGANAVDGFAQWWDSLHRRRGTQWSDNPLVWVLEFHRVPSDPLPPLAPTATSAG